MLDLQKTCRLALVQAAPVMFNKAGCVAKAEALIAEAAHNGAELIVFPELFIPGYPYGMTFGFKVGSRQEDGRKDWQMYYENSIVIPGTETERLAQAAATAKAYLSIGVSERDAVTATLYNSNLVIAPLCYIVFVHLKFKPIVPDLFVWGYADKCFAPLAATPWGPLGSLICWENYMPLLRTALYQKGMTLCAAPNTNDNPEWQATVRHIAIEGRCFFINADLYFTKAMYPAILHCRKEIAALPDVVCRGGSCVVDPYGHYVIEPFWDAEGIRYADLDMSMAYASRMEFDPCGHYARPDVLELKVKDL